MFPAVKRVRMNVARRFVLKTVGGQGLLALQDRLTSEDSLTNSAWADPSVAVFMQGGLPE
jgi:hypothetical protein